MARIRDAFAGRRDATPAVDGAEARRAAEIEALIATLRQQPQDMRRGANVSLTDLGVDDAFIPPLVAATRDADVYIRASAVHALVEYNLRQHPQAEAAVLHALADDAEAEVRAAAVLALGTQLGAAAHVYLPACLRALDDSCAEVRREAAQVLGHWPSEQAAAALRTRLHLDTDAEVRIWAIAGLARCDAANAIPDLFAAAADPDGSVRAAALGALRECLDTEDATLSDLLLTALSDPASEVRRQAAEGLRFGPPQALPALLAAANDPEPRVRLEVVIALGSLQDAQAVDALAARVFDEADEEVRYYAVSALGELHDARATQHLINAFETPALGHRVRWGALWALGERADPAALQVLGAALLDPDAEFRARAAESLTNPLWGTHADAACVQPALVTAARDPVAAVRRYACVAMGAIGATGEALALPALIETMQDDDESVRSEAALALAALGNDQAIAPLATRLEIEPEPYVRVRLVRALSFLSPQPVVPLLARSLGDGDDDVREQAAQALSEISTLAALQDLLHSLPQRDTAARHALQTAIIAREEEEAAGTWSGTRRIGRGTVHYV